MNFLECEYLFLKNIKWDCVYYMPNTLALETHLVICHLKITAPGAMKNNTLHNSM